MELSEAVSVSLGLPPSPSRDSDRDHASYDPDHTAAEENALHAELEKLDLKEANCNGGDEENGGSKSEEERGGESGDHENVNVNENENENEDDVANGDEKVSGGDDEVESKERGERRVISYHYPVRPDAEDCVYYLKTGNCKFGSNCKFNHPYRKKNQAVKERVEDKEDSAALASNTECKYYSRTGGCKYGNSCRYNHPKEKYPVTTTLDLNFLGLPIRPGERECPYYMRTSSCKYGANCRFNHPDPVTVGASSDSTLGYGNGRSALSSLQGAPQPAITSWSSPRTVIETAPYPPVMALQGVPSQNPEWNGFQAPIYPSSGYVMSKSATGIGLYNAYQQQQVQVEEFPERPGQPECTFFLKTGHCKFKSGCKYHHPKNRISRSTTCTLSDKGLPLRPDQNVCSHYSRYGICKFGPACRYDHPIDLIPSSGLENVDTARAESSRVVSGNNVCNSAVRLMI